MDWQSAMTGPVLETHRVAVVSTTHITAEDAETLYRASQRDEGVIVESPEYRWRVYLSPDDFWTHDLPTWRDLKMSDAFLIVLVLAHHQGARWIEFDQDGPEYTAFPSYDW